MRYLLFLSMLLSCAIQTNQTLKENSNINGYKYFELSDKTGNFLLKREVKLGKTKLLTRSTVYTRDGMQELEKQVSVSKIGVVKSKKSTQLAVLPEAAQFRVWYNKKEYSAEQKVITKSKKIKVKVNNPDKPGDSYSEYKIPKGSYFCYFSQIPECLKLQNLLLKAAQKSVQLFVMWDNFPFHTEQYDGLMDSPMILATLKLSDHTKEELKFGLDIGNQIIFYHYDKKLNFDKMFWISQGMSMISIAKE